MSKSTSLLHHHSFVLTFRCSRAVLRMLSTQAQPRYDAMAAVWPAPYEEKVCFAGQDCAEIYAFTPPRG